MSKSDGGTGSEKRGSFMKNAKATKELMDRFGFSSVEEIEAALSKAQQSAAEDWNKRNMAALKGALRGEARTPDEYDPSIDPIEWMRREDTIWFVSEITMFPGNTIPKPTKTQAGEVIEHLKAYAAKTWGNCPYKFIGRTAEETHNLRIEKQNHWHLRLDRHYADRVVASKFGYMPAAVPITPEDFTGRDYRNTPLGHKRKHSGDSLTELARFYLQSMAGKIWLDYTYHSDHIERHVPNPYGKGWDRFTVDPKTVLVATPEGDVQRDWGNA